jgi:hypothetical protein
VTSDNSDVIGVSNEMDGEVQRKPEYVIDQNVP